MSEAERAAYLAGETDGSLDPAERAELDSVRNLLADQDVWIEPPPGLEQRIIDTITAAASVPRGGLNLSASPSLDSTPSPAAPLDSKPTPATNLDSKRAQLASRRKRFAILGVAAAVVLAVGLAIGFAVRGSHSQSVQFAASLNATALEPGATGQATLTKTANGWRIHIDTSGIPRRDKPAYYEAWLKNAAGVLVPIGTFNQGKDVTLWAGVAPSDFPTLTITRQVIGGGQESSGKVVLAGRTKRVH